MSLLDDLWRGSAFSPEPPPHVAAVRDGDGHVADRLPEPCEYCGDGVGSIWRWRHNGRSECWLDIDGIPPWVEVREPSTADESSSARA